MVCALESKKNDCKNCYKCIRSCPTKSISFYDNQASIIHDDCILCGKCFLSCPQDAKEIRDDTEIAKDLVAENKQVFVSIAPSFLAAYQGSSIKTLAKALKTLGFYDVEETAVGATIVKKAYDEMINTGDKDIIISSCCTSVNLLIQKHYPKCLPFLANVLSPMLAHGKDIKERYPGAKVVFIGPCIAKKNEIELDQNHYVDCVLTFLELDRWLKESGVKIEKEKDLEIVEHSKARLFPTSGGILKTMDCSSTKYQYLVVDGIENVIDALKNIEKGNVHNCFIEMSSCYGSCISGPAMKASSRTLIEGLIAINKQAGKQDFKTSNTSYPDIQKTFHKIKVTHANPSEEDIKEVLTSMGKTDKSKELNCGSCGYNTCREKAIAIIEGKAVKEMCLPYLMEKAMSFSNNIVHNTPNGLMVLDESFHIQLMNKSMCRIISIPNSDMVIGKNISTILDPEPYALALSGALVKEKKKFLAEYDKYVEETIIYDPKFHIIISIMKDITAQQIELQKRSQLIKTSVEITNKVIEKNMRTVQEIASLLGESAAETKVALSSLKDSLKDDNK